MDDPRPELLTVPEAAAALRMSRASFYARVLASGKVRPVRIGRMVRVSRRALDAFVRELEETESK